MQLRKPIVQANKSKEVRFAKCSLMEHVLGRLQGRSGASIFTTRKHSVVF